MVIGIILAVIGGILVIGLAALASARMFSPGQPRGAESMSAGSRLALKLLFLGLTLLVGLAYFAYFWAQHAAQGG